MQRNFTSYIQENIVILCKYWFYKKIDLKNVSFVLVLLKRVKIFNRNIQSYTFYNDSNYLHLLIFHEFRVIKITSSFILNGTSSFNIFLVILIATIGINFYKNNFNIWNGEKIKKTIFQVKRIIFFSKYTCSFSLVKIS